MFNYYVDMSGGGSGPPPPPSIFSILSKCFRAFLTLISVTAEAKGEIQKHNIVESL